MIKYIGFIALLSLIPLIPAQAKLTQLTDSGALVELGGNFQFTDSQAANISGASFSKKMTNTWILRAGFSYAIGKGIILGIRVGTWLAEQSYEVGGESRSDQLTLYEVGPQVGYQWGNPRISYRLLGGLTYPFGLKIVRKSSTTQTFLPDGFPWVYEGRFQLNLKLNPWISWMLEGGYRLFQLGNFYSGSTSFISSGAGLNVSGPFIGTGIGIHF